MIYATAILYTAQLALAGLLLCLAVPAIGWLIRFIWKGGKR
jgi:hypothetical protein